MSSAWPWSLTMLLMMASVAQAIVIRHDTRDAHYLDAARSNAFANVGQLYSGSDMRGTGVLVGDRWVLTAAHVVGEARDDAWSFVIAGKAYASRSVHAHPGWTGRPTDGNDIALVCLTTPVHGVTPATLYDEPVEFDVAVTLLGYGWTGTGAEGITHADQQLRAATNYVEGSMLDCMLFFFDAPGSGAETELEGITAFNGSGGPVFVETDDGWKLSGINAFILDWNANGTLGDYGDAQGATRIEPFLRWIRAVTQPCRADVDDDGMIGFADLLGLIAAWGPCDGCAEDLDARGSVNFDDLVILLSHWGPCRHGK